LAEVLKALLEDRQLREKELAEERARREEELKRREAELLEMIMYKLGSRAAQIRRPTE